MDAVEDSFVVLFVRWVVVRWTVVYYLDVEIYEGTFVSVLFLLREREKKSALKISFSHVSEVGLIVF